MDFEQRTPIGGRDELMQSVHIAIPKIFKGLSEASREKITAELCKALNVDPPKPTTSERNIWTTNDEEFLGQAEDELYELLASDSMERLATLIAGLGLAHETTGYEDLDQNVLQKSIKDNGKHRISDLINLSQKKKQGFMQYIQDGSDWSKAKLKQIDDILKQKLPDYAKVAEQFAIRSAFLAKIRALKDTELLETMGAFIDRFPKTIEASRHEGIVLTLREQEKAKAEGRKVTILPLQPQEIRAVAMAEMRSAEKITEVSDRHRAKIKQVIIQAHSERWTAQKLAQTLFDAFGDQNRDWRRVAITELAMATNDAFLAGCSIGDEVWVPPVVGSCIHCQKLLEGKTFKVSDGPGNELTEVWVGKSNYGRITKEWIPCIPLHPHCRHRYHKLSRFYSVDENGKPKLKTTTQLIQEERVRRGWGLDPNLI